MKYYAVLVGLLFAWAPFAVGNDGTDFLASHGVGLEFDVSTGANKSLIGVDFRLGQLQSLDVERLRLPTSIVSMNLDALNLSTLEPVARLANLQSIVVGDGGNAKKLVTHVPMTQLHNIRDMTLRQAPILRQHNIE